jgi:hypothetical protein
MNSKGIPHKEMNFGLYNSDDNKRVTMQAATRLEISKSMSAMPISTIKKPPQVFL